MPGIDLNIICHRLHVNPACKPVAQKIRNFAPERVSIIEAEIDKLLAAGFIEEVSYSEWLAKVVLVAKQEKGKWRVCIDYTDLNKACAKDNFPLPRIDQLVDSTSGNQLLSFMDAYSGYNQILMHEDDKPIPSEDLFVYLAVSNSTVSSALIREELGAQHPVFYTSKDLLDAETRYPKLEKLILAFVVSARKLRPYYQAHQVIVMTDFPLRSILHSPNASQRLMKWAIELSQYDLIYRPKAAIKAQALANFVVEFTPSAEEEKLVNKNKESSRADGTSARPSQLRDTWQLRVDGASNQKGAGAGVVIITPDGTLLEQAITLGFPALNNEAEYEALLAGMRLAKDLAIMKLAIYSDSQLIANQASGEYMAKHPRMILYLDKVQELLKAFPTFTIQQVPRAENAHADALASLGSALDT
ncbi:unnamed protein product [Prunus armeniaca]